MSNSIPIAKDRLSPSSPSGAQDKIARILSQHERERVADASIARTVRQALWSARRVAIEKIRPFAARWFSLLVPHSRTLQKKLQRPEPKIIKYNALANREKPLILHFLANFEIGGTPQLVCDIVEYTQADFRHLVVSKHVSRPAPYFGIDLIDCALPLAAGTLSKLIRREKPALIHVHYWNGMQQDFIWYHSVFRTLQEFSIPVVENVNTSGEPYFSEVVKRYVFCSNWSRQSSGADWISEAVVYPGTRLEDFSRSDLSGVPDDQIGMVYRLGGDKIGPNAIEIFIQVMKSVPNAHSTIVGDGDLVAYFKSRVAEENLDSRIAFTGWVSYEHLQQIYRELAVFIAPVKDDTFGSVSVYAMCAGIPVVGFNVGGIPEIVGSPDLLAPPGDVLRLAEIVKELLLDRERRLRIGAENQRRAKELFSVSAMANSFDDLYRELINEHTDQNSG
jgi:glycosyltransferase involved in cell wall biosynthesis